MKAWDYQLEIALQVIEKLRLYMICYLAMEERTGKSITMLEACEQIEWVKRVLIISKKKALKDDEGNGWLKLLEEYPLTKEYVVVNYHSAHKVTGKFDIVILDEAHSYISGYPKTSKMWSDIYKIVYGLPIIYASATPYAQGPQLLYHQLKMSKWSPWKQFKNFYDWFKDYAQLDKYGALPIVRIGPSQTAIDYTCVNADKAIASVKHLFISKTRAELGFEHEPEDELHYIELSETTKAVYNAILRDCYLEFYHSRTDRDYTLVCDTSIKLRSSLHMLEGGVFKIDNEYIDLGNDEKAEYIKQTWGDNVDVVIMYQYIADKLKLERLFKNAKILQGTSYAEGVDLSMYKHLVIYSQDFSTAKHTQRRARQANRARAEEIRVHFLLVKRAISEQVYKTVSVNKTNFVDSVFKKEYL